MCCTILGHQIVMFWSSSNTINIFTYNLSSSIFFPIYNHLLYKMTQAKSEQRPKYKRSNLNNFFPDAGLPKINPKYSTLPDTTRPEYHRRSIPIEYIKKDYSKDDIERIKNQTQQPVEKFQSKYYRPHGAAKCQKLELVLQRNIMDRAGRVKSKSMREQRLERKNNLIKARDLTYRSDKITSCSLIQSIYYG